MTLDTAVSKALYLGNGTARRFPLDFKVWDASELSVSVSCNGRDSRNVTAQCDIELSDTGGIVTYPREGAPLPEGCTLSIVRNMPFTQGIDLVSASRFDPQVIEDGLDQATAERQQLLEQLSRAVILPPTSEQSPQEVVEEVYAARDQAGQSAADAAVSAEAAKHSATLADGAARLADQSRQTACQCADRAEQARDVALEQTATVNTLMATELAKITALVAANKDDQTAALAQARQWAENPEDAPVAVDPQGNPEYSARHWALKSSQLMAADASKTQKGVVRVGQGIEVDQGVISVRAASESAPGLVRPDGLTCAVSAAGVLSVNPQTGYLTEFRNFFEQSPPPGWAARNGAVLERADSAYPALWAALHEEKNAWKCKSLEEWSALSTAAGGCGGAPFFVLDEAARTVKLPDTRGDFARDAGSSFLEAVGAWHGDAIRNIEGELVFFGGPLASSSPLFALGGWLARVISSPGPASYSYFEFDASKAVPTAAENRVRAYAALGCVYVGIPVNK